MNLYTIFLIYNVVMAVFSKNIEIKSGFEMPIPWSIGLKFFAKVENNAGEDYIVEVHPERCCLDSYDSKCNIVNCIGSANEIIGGGASKTLTMVAPLIDPYKRKGYCTLFVDSGPAARPKNIKRETIKIKFNTKLKNYFVSDQIKPCKNIDEDPMNGCNPVDCDSHYNGKKSHYSVIKKRCVPVPSCTSPHLETPYLAYNPISNRCVPEPTISKQDLNYIREISDNNFQRAVKHVTIISVTNTPEVPADTYVLNSNFSAETITESVRESAKVDDEEIEDKNDVYKRKKSKSRSKVKAVNKNDLRNMNDARINSTTAHRSPSLAENKLILNSNLITTLVRCCSANRYATVFLATVIFMQCFLICTLVYCISKNCCCFKSKKPIINKYFNNRQDMSVTTPLIGTSNVDTDTTDYQYLSESSNYIDKKIKCYKACQKERKNNAKISMSDDILSKCITRRDWHRLPRSETIPEMNNDDDIATSEEIKDASGQKKIKDIKVNFQDEYQDKQAKNIKSMVKKDSKNKQDRLSDSSEQEIRCLSYNYNNCNLDLNKNSDIIRNIGVYNQENKKASGAQAYFSNDSIDDFLSERGVVFIGDDASKYSFSSSSSAMKSSVTSQSSKTSKNNIVKNVMTLLSRKTKGPASDPGIKVEPAKIECSLDLELLHQSRATVYSSSDDTDMGKDIKNNKESTSSL